jgi:hypothetical protein
MWAKLRQLQLLKAALVAVGAQLVILAFYHASLTSMSRADLPAASHLPVVTFELDGRLGNWLLEYATLFLLARKHNITVKGQPDETPSHPYRMALAQRCSF